MRIQNNSARPGGSNGLAHAVHCCLSAAHLGPALKDGLLAAGIILILESLVPPAFLQNDKGEDDHVDV